jgi:hypothetical protein
MINWVSIVHVGKLYKDGKSGKQLPSAGKRVLSEASTSELPDRLFNKVLDDQPLNCDTNLFQPWCNLTTTDLAFHLEQPQPPPLLRLLQHQTRSDSRSPLARLYRHQTLASPFLFPRHHLLTKPSLCPENTSKKSTTGTASSGVWWQAR